MVFAGVCGLGLHFGGLKQAVYILAGDGEFSWWHATAVGGMGGTELLEVAPINPSAGENQGGEPAGGEAGGSDAGGVQVWADGGIVLHCLQGDAEVVGAVPP